jgi:hypothetical protein
MPGLGTTRPLSAVTDGLAIRILITFLATAQAGIAALLGFAEILPQEAKIGLVVASAMLAVLLNQVPSWQSAPAAGRALKKAGAD